MQASARFKTAGVFVALVLLSANGLAQAQANTAGGRREIETAGDSRPKFIKAFVVDDRLSALRRGPGAQSEIINRLRLARVVYIIESRRDEGGRARFYRVAVTRRTRGWIHSSALAVASRTGEDERVWKLIESAASEIDRITLCKLFVENFSRSRLQARALLRMGEEAERAAIALSQRARKRLVEVDPRNQNATLKDYYLNDPGLDRYSRLRVVFNFNETSASYTYDGKAYREISRRFPGSEEARIARQRLEAVEQKSARKK